MWPSSSYGASTNLFGSTSQQQQQQQSSSSSPFQQASSPFNNNVGNNSGGMGGGVGGMRSTGYNNVQQNNGYAGIGQQGQTYGQPSGMVGSGSFFNSQGYSNGTPQQNSYSTLPSSNGTPTHNQQQNHLQQSGISSSSSPSQGNTATTASSVAGIPRYMSGYLTGSTFNQASCSSLIHGVRDYVPYADLIVRNRVPVNLPLIRFTKAV